MKTGTGFIWLRWAAYLYVSMSWTYATRNAHRGIIDSAFIPLAKREVGRVRSCQFDTLLVAGSPPHQHVLRHRIAPRSVRNRHKPRVIVCSKQIRELGAISLLNFVSFSSYQCSVFSVLCSLYCRVVYMRYIVLTSRKSLFSRNQFREIYTGSSVSNRKIYSDDVWRISCDAFPVVDSF